MTEVVDLLVVGSGPVGAAFARRVATLAPSVSILMVEAGPRLTTVAGENVRNLDLEPRASVLEALAEYTKRPPQWTGVLPARPGTALVAPVSMSPSNEQGMPAAAMSTNVGGMAAHWTCAAPRPGPGERIAWLPKEDFDASLAVAEDLLGVTTRGFAPTGQSEAVRAMLSDVVGDRSLLGRPVQAMPMACEPRPGFMPRWVGADRMLAWLESTSATCHFELRPRTVCCELIADRNRVEGAVLRRLASGEETCVQVGAVAVAADAFRTPQLLWTSGIRPPALGCYLNDQPQIQAAIQFGKSDTAPGILGGDARDRISYGHWVPYSQSGHPFSGTVVQIDDTTRASASECETVLGMSWFCEKELQQSDRVTFHSDNKDDYGLPAPEIHYRLTRADLEAVDAARGVLGEIATAAGGFLPGGDPQHLPSGSSLHYQGTTRMGEGDDGTSVCDADSRVWGFDNLFVGGNSVIPTATACNPTLTSVALAVLSSKAIAARLCA